MNRSILSKSGREIHAWPQFVIALAGAATITTVLFSTAASAESGANVLPNMAGTYNCVGDKVACGWSGTKFTIKQSGADLEISNEKGDYGHAKMTSNISLSAGPIWNMLGVIISSDNRVIQWSNGTNWERVNIS